MGKYPTEPLKCWNKAKDLRNKFYENFDKAHERGGLRVMGSAWEKRAASRPCARRTQRSSRRP